MGSVVTWLLIGGLAFSLAVTAIVSSSKKGPNPGGCTSLPASVLNAGADAGDNTGQDTPATGDNTGNNTGNTGGNTGGNNTGGNNTGGNTGGNNTGGNTGGNDTGGNTGGNNNGGGNNDGGNNNGGNGGVDGGGNDGGNNNGGNDGGNNGGNNGSQNLFASKTFSGLVTLVSTQSLNGTPGNPSQPTTSSFSMAFDETGRPTGVLVYGFASATDQLAAIRNVGDRVTLTDSGFISITNTVRVTAAQYSNTSIHLELAMQYRGTAGQLIQNGTGTQSIDLVFSGADIQYTVETSYTVRQSAGSINFDTGEVTMVSGTLSAQ